jgi:hypothetical protein
MEKARTLFDKTPHTEEDLTEISALFDRLREIKEIYPIKEKEEQEGKRKKQPTSINVPTKKTKPSTKALPHLNQNRPQPLTRGNITPAKRDMLKTQIIRPIGRGLTHVEREVRADIRFKNNEELKSRLDVQPRPIRPSDQKSPKQAKTPLTSRAQNIKAVIGLFKSNDGKNFMKDVTKLDNKKILMEKIEAIPSNIQKDLAFNMVEKMSYDAAKKRKSSNLKPLAEYSEWYDKLKVNQKVDIREVQKVLSVYLNR